MPVVFLMHHTVRKKKERCSVALFSFFFLVFGCPPTPQPTALEGYVAILYPVWEGAAVERGREDLLTSKADTRTQHASG